MPIRTFQRLLYGEPADRVDDREPGARRALGVVLMRFRIAEIDQHAVAHILGDKAGKAGDRVGDAAMIRANDLAQILGIEARRQRSRADQIAEHQGQLAPLGRAEHIPRYRRRCSRNRTAAQRGDRRQQPAPITDRRDADLFQIVCVQVPQHVPIDRVFREGRRVPPEAETTQPLGNVHGFASLPHKLNDVRGNGEAGLRRQE